MSILVAANRYKEIYSGAVKFTFAGFNPADPKLTDKPLKFLATEGFLDQVFKVGDIIYFGDNQIQVLDKDILLAKIIHLDTKLNYTNCTVIKAQIINTSKLFEKKNTAGDWLNEQLSEAKIGLLGKESELIIQDVLYKIKIFLDETLHNISQHAYNDKNAWASIYVRFRNGTRNKSISVEERIDLQNNIELESKYCPRLNRQFVEENNCFVEIFVLDSGLGVATTYYGKERRLAFRNAIDEIFRLGKRRKSSELKNMTARGGLNLIYDLLQQDRDYICGYSDSEWIGDVVPFSKQNPVLFYDPGKVNSVCAAGVCWIARLSMNSGTQLNQEDWKSWVGHLYDNPVFFGYKDQQYSHEELADFQINDNRFPGDAFSKFSPQPIFDVIRAQQSNVVILLAGQLITKIKVWENIDKTLHHHSPLGNNDSKVLIIGDIPEKEALTYAAALIQARIYENASWKSKITDIILITQKFYVCVLSKIKDENSQSPQPSFTFVKDDAIREQYIHAIHYDPALPNPARSIREYINFLKSYDSYLFWFHLRNHSLIKYLFINQKIKWGEPDVYINGYLNFSLTLTQQIFLQLYKLSLTRCFGLFHNKVAALRNTDDLTTKLCEEFNSNLEINNTTQALTLYLGSVYGSGTNEKNTLINYPKINNDLVANFFIHPGVEEFRPRIALLFWPNADELKQFIVDANPVPYQRIGKSHTIAPYGWKYFPIPRYEADGKSFYQRNPRETYNDWQSISNAIISFGNVSYQNFTDLFRVDIKKALEYTFKYKTELAKYLIIEFAYVFNARNEDDFARKEYFNFWQMANTIESHKLTFYENIGLILYPNHLNTSLAINYIQSTFTNINEENQLIPVDFTQSYHESNAYLISPLTLERIKDALNKQAAQGKNNVLFFDCTIVSGKTRKQIYHILEGLGVGTIRTLTILDRSRLPYNLPKKDEIRSFWRMDVPRLANGDYNPINASLQEIATMKTLFTEPAKMRYDQWSKAWGNNVLGIVDAENGIEPSRLPAEAQQTKKFGVYNFHPHDQIGGRDNLIDLVNSFGLSIYCAEAHSMTGRNDLSLSMIEEFFLPPSIIIELMASQLLLFPHDFSTDLRLKMLKQLFQASLSIPDSDNHTALAAIVLLRQGGNIITALFKDMFRIHNMQDAVTNMDLRIGMAYLVNKFGLQDLYDINSYDSILIKNQEDNIWQIYKRFHFEIYEGKGKMHSRPILEIFSSEPKTFEQKLHDAIVSFSRLKSIFKNDIKEWFLRSTGKPLTHAAIVKKMDDSYKNSLAILESKNADEYVKFSNSVKSDLLPFLQNVHSALFTLISSKNDSVVQRRLSGLITEMIRRITPERWRDEGISKKISHFSDKVTPVILVSAFTPDFPESYKSHDNLWVVFDRRVQEELENLLYNALYANLPFQDPNNKADVRKAHMWVGVNYEKDKLTINFINSIKESFEKVRTDIIKGQTDAHRHCVFDKALNGHSDIIRIYSDETNLIQVTLTLPVL